jgi:hypothetical protein
VGKFEVKSVSNGYIYGYYDSRYGFQEMIFADMSRLLVHISKVVEEMEAQRCQQ